MTSDADTLFTLPDAAANSAPKPRRGMRLAVDPATLLDGLNPQQRKAVVHQGGPLLIVAARVGQDPGAHQSGRLPARRARCPSGRDPRDHLHEQGRRRDEGARRGARRAAARSMWVSTFHSMCVRILRADGSSLGLKSSFLDLRRGRLDPADDARLPRARPRRQALPAPVAHRAGQQSQERAGHPAAWVDKASNAHEKVLAEAYTRYQSRLREAHALDFDDLIMSTVQLLQDHADVAEKYRKRFPARAGRRVPGPPTTLNTFWCASSWARGRVGGRGRRRPVDLRVPRRDDPQHPRVRARLPGRTTILLEQNYRSTQTILNAAKRRHRPQP